MRFGPHLSELLYSGHHVVVFPTAQAGQTAGVVTSAHAQTIVAVFTGQRVDAKSVQCLGKINLEKHY